MVGLLAVGCGTTPTKERVAGIYVPKYPVRDYRKNGYFRHYFMEDGRIVYFDEKFRMLPARDQHGKWRIVGKEIHVFESTGPGTAAERTGKWAEVYRHNSDTLTGVASIDEDGKRTALPASRQDTLKKIGDVTPTRYYNYTPGGRRIPTSVESL